MSEPRYTVEVDAKRRPPARVQDPASKVWYYATGRRGTACVSCGSRDDNRRVYEYKFDPYPRSFGRGHAPETVWVWLDGNDVRILTDYQLETEGGA